MRELLRCAAITLGVFGATAGVAQSPKPDPAYPTRPIRLIVSFTPGGGADLSARTVGQKMSDTLGQPVVVENRPGANGLVGADAVAKAAPDGYTMLLTDRGALGINPSLYKKIPYDPLKDFAYVGIVTMAPYVIGVDPRLGVNTLNELVALAKSKPGAINYASFGIASMAHLNIEALKARMVINLTHVPYKGAGPAVQAVVAGEAGLTIASPAAVLGFVRDGRMRAIGIEAPKRSTLLPDVPTLAESGVSDEVLAPTYFAFALPAGTPAAIVARLNAETKRALSAKDVADRLNGAGLEPHGGSPEELLDLIRRDIPRFARLIKEIGIQPE